MNCDAFILTSSVIYDTESNERFTTSHLMPRVRSATILNCLDHVITLWPTFTAANIDVKLWERRRGPVVGHSLWTRPARVQSPWEARIIRCKNLALYIRDCESLCLSDETVKAVGPFYLVSMPGEVKDPTQGVNV